MSLIECVKSGGEVDVAALKEVLAKYPWFEAARALEKQSQNEANTRYSVDVEKIAEESSGEIISRFLRKGDYKIVAEEGDVEGEIMVEANIDEEDDLVSEELAEIYISQGLRKEAIEIYRKLSLLNSEKSIYFAEKIENIKKNN
jgi:hypothetical protein